MSWTKNKKSINKDISDLYASWKREDDAEVNNLFWARMLVSKVWSKIDSDELNLSDEKKEKWFSIYEFQISEEVKSWWGRDVKFNIDRDKKIFICTHQDGRSMNLINGDVL